MIKQLITDLANDKITLSQALVRSKLIAYKINNETFKNWIKKETEGYSFDDSLLPEYRKVFSEMSLIAQFTGGKETIIPFTLPEQAPKEVLDTIYFHQIIEPISIVELQIGKTEAPENGRITLPNAMMEMIKSTLSRPLLLQIQMSSGVIDRLQRKINTIQYHNVVNLTKNKLLDILLELEQEFPNIENDYTMSEENNKKAENIITTNIYGGTAPVNIATGDNASQSIILTIESIDFKKLQELGVETKEIEDLQTIITETKSDKNSLPGKIFGWLSSVSASFVSRGLYEKLPELTSYIQTFI